jgi:aromatic ring-opening dioxygenase catalytic subunit (LigB family)
MQQTKSAHIPTVVYLSHGGGPLPLLGDPEHAELVENLKTIAASIEKPTAIVLVSAHWEAEKPTVTAGAMPTLIYDYYGFPEESYAIQYPATGEPRLANKIASLLRAKGIDADLDTERGFDHGLFVPLKIMYPEADIPCVQLSLVKGLDPKEHIQIGEALAELPQEGVLIIGSGFSFHNLSAFFTSTTAESRSMNEAFEAWLIETCTDKNIDEEQRSALLEN